MAIGLNTKIEVELKGQLQIIEEDIKLGCGNKVSMGQGGNADCGSVYNSGWPDELIYCDKCIGKIELMESIISILKPIPKNIAYLNGKVYAIEEESGG